MRISYLATNYPFVSHTFIQGEVRALEAIGVEVRPTALNRLRDTDVLSERDEAEAARTYHIKATPPGRMVAVVAGAAVRHPLAFARGLLRSQQGQPGLRERMRRLAQFGEGVLLWHDARRAGVHAIHAHFGQAPAAVARAAAGFGTDAAGRRGPRWTWSVTLHGWHEFATEERSDLRSKIADADLVVCISDFTRAQVLRLSEADRWDKVVVVRCGVDLDDFSLRAPRAVGAVPHIVTVARLSPEKGHLVLLEAMQVLRAEGVAVTATFIGDGPFEADLRRAAARLGVSDAVTFAGAQPPSIIADTLREADIFCLPSFAEGLPVSIMEAMAVGVPVVTTYISGTPELVDHGVTGWIVPAGNAALLASAIRDVTTSPARADIVGAARAAVAERHDLTRNAKELADALQRCHDPEAAGVAH